MYQGNKAEHNNRPHPHNVNLKQTELIGIVGGQ